KRREIPETKNSRTDYRESGLLSAHREYLHITRQRLVIDVCGATFGTGFFVSWWLAEAKLNLNPIIKVVAILIMFGLASEALTQWGLFAGSFAIVLVVIATLAIVNSMAGS